MNMNPENSNKNDKNLNKKPKEEEWNGEFDEYQVSFKKSKLSAINPEYINDRWFTQEASADHVSTFDGLISEHSERIKYFENFTKSKNYNGVPDQETISRIIEQAKKMQSLQISRIKKFINKTFVENPSKKQIYVQNFYLEIINESDVLYEKFHEILNKKEYKLFDHIKSHTSGYLNAFTSDCAKYITNNPDFMTDELIIKISQERRKIFEENETILLERKDQLEADFTQRFKEFKEKYSIDINIDQIREILKNTKITCVDPLVGKLENKSGQYETQKHLISINYNNMEKFIEYIYNHEALHAISGTTILKEDAHVKTRIKDEYNEDDQTEYFPLRFGLQFTKPNDIIGGTYGRKERNFKSTLHWLNEAITEGINVEMMGEDHSIYRKQREILQYLINNSEGRLKKSDFFNAYFENYDQLTENKIPYWKDLFSKIQDSYDPTFLQRLDHIIKEKGVEKVSYFLEKNSWKNLNVKNIE